MCHNVAHSPLPSPAFAFTLSSSVLIILHFRFRSSCFCVCVSFALLCIYYAVIMACELSVSFVSFFFFFYSCMCFFFLCLLSPLSLKYLKLFFGNLIFLHVTSHLFVCLCTSLSHPLLNALFSTISVRNYESQDAAECVRTVCVRVYVFCYCCVSV